MPSDENLTACIWRWSSRVWMFPTSLFKNNETARIGGCSSFACKIGRRSILDGNFQESKKKSTVLQTKYSAFWVENSGIEPLTSCMPCKRSPEPRGYTPHTKLWGWMMIHVKTMDYRRKQHYLHIKFQSICTCTCFSAYSLVQ